MATVIWTVILGDKCEYTFETALASRDPNRARSELTTRYPGRKVVALIMGRHITHTFDVGCTDNVSWNDSSDNDNQPTRGSD